MHFLESSSPIRESQNTILQNAMQFLSSRCYSTSSCAQFRLVLETCFSKQVNSFVRLILEVPSSSLCLTTSHMEDSQSILGQASTPCFPSRVQHKHSLQGILRSARSPLVSIVYNIVFSFKTISLNCHYPPRDCLCQGK